MSEARARLVAALAAWTVLPALALSSAPVTAQDVEAAARARGVPLPAAYYRTRASTPGAFELSSVVAGRASTISEGVVTLPVVLTLFSDSDEPHITRDDVDAALFVGPAARGTVTAAYDEMSRGALTVNGDVFEWTRSGYTLTQAVGADFGLGAPSEQDLGEHFVDGLAALDGDVDWGQYDNDGPDGVPNSGDDDGYVDIVTFEFLEIAASCGGPGVWPHRWSMTAQSGEPFVTDDPAAQDSVSTIRVNDYITQSVSDCSGEVVQDASTIAHEFGHALGLPDYYHRAAGLLPEERRWVLGCWALMAGGSWGCGPVGGSRGPFGPTHMMAHSKERLGWIEWTDPGEVWNEEIVLDPVQTSGQALRIPMGAEGTEYLIVEYRAHHGFDEQLPADGVLMYKLDETASRAPDPASSDPYFLTLLEQDGNRGLVRTSIEGGNRGEPGDAWGVGGVTARLNAETVPELILSGGGRTPVMVHEVRVEAGQARLVISTGATPVLVEPGEPFEVMRVRTFLAAVRIAGGTGPYTATGDVPDDVFLGSAGDELLIAGSVVDEGPYDLSLRVVDALGNESNELTVQLSAPVEWVVELESLLQSFLASEAAELSPGELGYLDDVGNRNGTYDVGDLRRWLREQAPGR